MLIDAPLKSVPGLHLPVIDETTPEGLAALRRIVAGIDSAGFVNDVRRRGRGRPVIAGGAEIFPDEGLDHVLNKVPRATTAIQTTYYLGLFAAGTDALTASTVPGRTEVNSTSVAAMGEPSAGAYARVAVVNTDWGAIATNASGRRTTSAQKSFPENTGSWGNVNGFFLAQQLATGAGSVAIFYANFDDTTAVPATVAGYTIRVTPYFHIDQ
jgi:hypothetical protein